MRKVAVAIALAVGLVVASAAAAEARPLRAEQAPVAMDIGWN
jgi:hypothetical protein